MSLIKVTDENFESQVLASQSLVLLDFGATWCGPCKALDPVLEEISGEYDGRILVAKVDVEQTPKIAERYGVFSVPTVVFLKDGEEVDRFVGAERKDKILKKIEARI